MKKSIFTLILAIVLLTACGGGSVSATGAEFVGQWEFQETGNARPTVWTISHNGGNQYSLVNNNQETIGIYKDGVLEHYGGRWQATVHKKTGKLFFNGRPNEFWHSSGAFDMQLTKKQG